MAIYEQDVAMFETKENGDKVIKMPISRANNIEGIGRSANTAYVVGDVVYVDNNKKVALKCIRAGTTSNSELNVSTANIGDTVTDGSVVWQVCNRTSDVTSVNGKTGDVVVGEIVDASISGKVITLTFADGTTKTLTTQDTNTHPMPNYNAGVNITSKLKTSPYSYTAPSDGVIRFFIYGDASWCINATNSQNRDNSLIYLDGGTGIYITSYLIVKKGQVIYETGDHDGDVAMFYPFA